MTRLITALLVPGLFACGTTATRDAAADAPDAAPGASRRPECAVIDPPTPGDFVFDQCALAADASVGCSAPPAVTRGGVALDSGQQAFPVNCRITWPTTSQLYCSPYFCTCQGSDVWICPL